MAISFIELICVGVIAVFVIGAIVFWLFGSSGRRD
jgi:hypothetical protein